MSRRSALFTCLFSVLGFGSSLFGQGPGGAELPTDEMLGRFGLQRAWWGQATLDPARDRVQFFTTDEQATFLQSDSGTVTAFDNATGRRLWAIQLGDSNDVRYRLVSNDALALVVSGTKMYAIDKKKGEVYWTVTIPSAPSTAPGIDDARAYVGSTNGVVYAFSLQILDQLAKRNEVAKYEFRALIWQYQTGNRVVVAPVSTGNIVAIASRNGSLYGLSALEHRVQIQIETGLAVSGPIAQLGSRIFVVTEDMKVYCIDADAAALKWELLTGLYVRESPRIIGQSLFLHPLDGGLHCYDASNGKEIWTNEEAGSFLAATPDLVFASDARENVLLLNRSDGRRVGAFPLRQFSIRIANDRTDRLYFATRTGLVLCLRERGRDFPLFHKNPERRPVLPDIAPDEGAPKAGPDVKPPKAKTDKDAAAPKK